jgi:CheY-like chemotaxis protein
VHYLRCPRCGLTIVPKPDWLTVEHCPRCVARTHRLVQMVVSTLAESDHEPEVGGIQPAAVGGGREAAMIAGAGSESTSPLLDLAREVIGEPNTGVALERILEVALALTGARYGALAVLNDRGDGLERFHTVGVEPDMHRLIGLPPRGRGVLASLITERRALRLHDVRAHPDSYGFPDGHAAMRTFLGVPLQIGGVVWGNLYFAEKAGDADFTESDEKVATIAADMVTTVLERAKPAVERASLQAELAALRDGATASPGERTTVLLVEDEPALRTLVATLLEDEGYLVLQAENGLDAVEVGERHGEALDLLVTDVVMPMLSGPEIALRLRGLRPSLPVLYMSGYTDTRLLSRGVDEASANLLVKPFTAEQLIAAVETLTAGPPEPAP